MTEPEPEKKSKKLLEQERLGLEEVTTNPKTTKDIDWNDPSVQRYWDMKNKPKSEAQARKNMIIYLKNQSNYKMKDFDGMSYDEIMPIFEKVWDFNHNFVPMDLEIEKEKKKPAEFQVEQIEKDTTGKRKKSLPRKRTRSTTKRQKVELDDEKEDLKGYLDIVPREDIAVDVDSLSTRISIVYWKTYTLPENFMYYKIIRGDGSSKNYKILSEMLYDFDRQDIVELYKLIKESSHSADGKWNCHTYAYRKEVSSKSRNDIKDAEIRLCTHVKRQGRERDSRNAVWPEPTNGKEVRVEVGDKVMLEVSSWKDEVHFGKKEMLAPRYEYWTDANMHVPLERIKVDKTLCFAEEPVEIIDREVKSLKRSRILIVKSIGTRSESCYTAIYTLVWASEVVSSGFPIVKVRRDSKCGPKFTWEREDHMKANYACSDSLLLTPLCYDDIHDVTPRVSTLAGCDRVVSESGYKEVGGRA
ncbi:hypothetical protein Tco_0819992 [Tanacetum coccineum]|uniref:Uncharacterized protein n=1 Tax=Tanacetum coccineum TaxID=301880 RepID=A0ABQ5A960_9ASTR